MRTKAIFLGLGLLLGSFTFGIATSAQGRQSAGPAVASTMQPGRYQTVWNHDAPTGLTGLGFFMIDTSTGRVWRYEVANPAVAAQDTLKSMAACKTSSCFVELDRVSLTSVGWVSESGRGDAK